MSNLTGFDSEAVGFDCVSQNSRPSKSSASQTTEFVEIGTGSQTNTSEDTSSMVCPEDLKAEVVNKEYPPPGLNEFLRRVVPAMMQQLDQNDAALSSDSSDSDDEDAVSAKLLQEISLQRAAGDHGSVLGVTWSGAGNSLAACVGQHGARAESAGVVSVYTLKQSEDRFVHSADLAEKSCVTALQYHPSLAGLLAYGTSSGEVVVYNLSDGGDCKLASADDRHGCRRVSALRWADAPLVDRFLALTHKTPRRADQVLVSAGADGTLDAWHVNAGVPLFEHIVQYAVSEARGRPADVTCFDFVKSPSRPDVFVVGTKSGKLSLCKVQPASAGVDPSYVVVQPHAASVLDAQFSRQETHVFASVSVDAELRLYDIDQSAPLQVLWLHAPVWCLCWAGPRLLLGLGGLEPALRAYEARAGRPLRAAGLAARGPVRCVAANSGSSGALVATGDDAGTVHVWELPSLVKHRSSKCTA
ncbi:cytoplasmic dynein 2 intermediate chain 2-like [Bicyclus anynana]|uniref:Cytoplasmic dynein 2 intermediate chain 2-like n=1 Tax=Bicyclus anynana TaxID=110368 RepID=A0ABM3M4K4_BICAN|nr:cytoplasmic dynein 2 intermediate chain 2-like [Bicyclus anynana]